MEIWNAMHQEEKKQRLIKKPLYLYRTQRNNIYKRNSPDEHLNSRSDWLNIKTRALIGR